MEDVLDLYAEQPDPKRPVVCFNQSPTQLIGEARQPIPAAPGRLERFDYELRSASGKSTSTSSRMQRAKSSAVRRSVTLTLRQERWASTKTKRLTAPLRQFRVVLDNLSTHTAAALYPDSHRPKRAACSGGLSSTTRPSTPAGSTWLRSRWRARRPMSRSPHRKLRPARCRDRRLAVSAKPKRRSNQLDVLHRQGQNQNGACLSRSLARKVIISVQGN